MDYFVIVDMRGNNGSITALMNEGGTFQLFPSVDDALAIMERHPLNVFPFYVAGCEDLENCQWGTGARMATQKGEQ